MPTWLGYPTAEETAAAEAKKLDAAIKNGTAGRITNDPAEQRGVVEYRRKKAAAEKARENEKAVLEARRSDAKNFHLQQELIEPQMGPHAAPPSNLGSRDRDSVVAVRNKMESAMPYRGELGLFKSRKPKDNLDRVLEETKVARAQF